jgi:flagellin
MALTVATNTGALMAQAAASSVNKEMETSMERLASGKRINGASDDAAGVAIASRLTSEIRGTNQAIRNAMDGQAMIDTAEGAHQEIEAILQRMRELAVQAANDTNSSNDRTNLQAEATALSTEIDRIAETTSWAGINLLDASGGASGSFEFQVGSRSSAQDEITVSIGSMTSATLGVTANNTSAGGATLTEIAHNAIQIGGTVKAGDIYSFTINDEAMTYTAVTADENANADTARAAVAAKIVTAIQAADNDHAGLTVSASGDTVTLNHDVQRFTAASADTVTAGASLSGDVLKLTFSDFATTTAGTFTINGEVVEVTAGTFTTASKYGMSQLGMKQAFEDAIAAETNLKGLSIAVSTSSTDALEFTVTSRDNTATFIQSVGANPAAGSSTINLDTANNAQTAIGLIDTAIQNVNAQRANLGAVSNRLDSTVSNLTNISSNLQAGRGRIEDADFAAETTSLAKSQILQQASTAMLAQANASKQNVLSLLQG